MHHRLLLPFLSLVSTLGLLVLLGGCALPSLPGQTRGPQPLPAAQQVFHPLIAGPKAGDLDSLDPALIQFNGDYNLAQLIFPPLLTLDDHNQVAHWGADSWSVSPDDLTWTFKLHPGMRWSDGTPIDATTYAYSINRSLDPCTQSPVSYYLSGQSPFSELIKGSYAFTNGTCPQVQAVSTQTLVGTSMVVVNPLTLQLVLSHPAAYFPMALTYPTAWAQPRQLIEQYGTQWTDHLADRDGFGGNLFEVKRWDHAGHFELVRNVRFWGTKPKLREIDWILYKALDPMWADYQAGKGDYVSTSQPAALPTARALPGFHEEPDIETFYLVPNWRVPPFDDVRVRQAFDLALDRSTPSQVPPPPSYYFRSSKPTIHMVPEGMPGYNPNLADPAGRTGGAALSPDVAHAGALWKAYVDDKWHGDASKAPPVVFAACYPFPAGFAIYDAFVRQWQAAMPGLRVSAGHFCGGTQVHRAAIFQFTSGGWYLDYPDPQDFLSLLVHTGALYNQSSISLPSADALMEQADANFNPVQRLQQYQEAEQQLVNAVAWIPFAQGLNEYVVRPRVAGGYHERASEVTALAVWQRIYVTSAPH